MAKIKTPQQLRNEAKLIASEARKKQAEILKLANDLENKQYVELGKHCIEFLEGKIDFEKLKHIALKKDLLKEDDTRETINE